MKPAPVSVSVSFTFARRVGALVLGLTVGGAIPAWASDGWGWVARRDDCAPGTRHARAEWWPEFCLSRRLNQLDCNGLAAEAESQRLWHNQQALAPYLRPVAAPRPVTGPPPSSLLQPV